jgi:hypothetical protein
LIGCDWLGVICCRGRRFDSHQLNCASSFCFSYFLIFFFSSFILSSDPPIIISYLNISYFIFHILYSFSIFSRMQHASTICIPAGRCLIEQKCINQSSDILSWISIDKLWLAWCQLLPLWEVLQLLHVLHVLHVLQRSRVWFTATQPCFFFLVFLFWSFPLFVVHPIILLSYRPIILSYYHI